MDQVNSVVEKSDKSFDRLVFFATLRFRDGETKLKNEIPGQTQIQTDEFLIDERIKKLIQKKNVVDEAPSKINVDIAIENCHAVVFDQVWNEPIKAKNQEYDLEVQAGRFTFEKTYYATFSFIVRFKDSNDIKKSLELKEEINAEIKKIVEIYSNEIGGIFPQMFFRSMTSPDFYTLYYLGTSGKILTEEKSNFLHAALGLTMNDNKRSVLNDTELIGKILDNYVINIPDLGMFYSEGNVSVIIPDKMDLTTQEDFDEMFGSAIQLIFMVELTNYELYRNWEQIKNKLLGFRQLMIDYYTAKRNLDVKRLAKQDVTGRLYREKNELDKIFSNTTTELGYIIESNVLYNGMKSKEMVYDFVATKSHLKDGLAEVGKAQTRLKDLIDEINTQIDQLESEKMARNDEKRILIYEISTIVAIILSIISILIKI